MDPVKVEAVKNWSTPSSLCDLLGFLGFANFYRRFIKGFAQMAWPLNDMTKKEVKWNWGPEQETAFQSLKAAFVSSPILVLWDPSCPLRIVEVARWSG